MPELREIKTVWSTKEPVGLVAGPRHPLMRRATVRLSDCVGYPLIFPAWALTIRPVIENALVTANLELRPAITSNSIAMIKASVRCGASVAFLTRIDVSAELLSGALAFRPIADHRLRPETLTLSVNATRQATPLVAVITETLREELTQMIGQIKR
jgi:DNA-binding transcriptional LysR family regulator